MGRLRRSKYKVLQRKSRWKRQVRSGPWLSKTLVKFNARFSADKLHPDGVGIYPFDLCTYCGAPSQTWDHIEPLHLGGGHGWNNLVRACEPCNKAKGSASLLEFLLDRRRQHPT